MTNQQNIRDLGNEIFVIEKLLSPELCQQIIEIAQFNSSEKVAGIALEQENINIRSNSLLRLEGNSLLNSTNELLLEKISLIQWWLYDYYGIKFPHAETCSILCYQKGQFYKRHVDNMLLSSRLEEAQKGVPIRDISIVGYLNEGFEGGETFFDRQNIKVIPQQGNVLVFPANFPYPHQSLPILSGEKWCFTTWLFY